MRINTSEYNMIKPNKIILLVGLIGSGKTSVGKRLAKKLNLPFVDGDQEIEKAAGLSVIDVFKCFGQEEYRAGEERIMKRLLSGSPCVLASGGGAFVAEQTRAIAKENALTFGLRLIWMFYIIGQPVENAGLFCNAATRKSETSCSHTLMRNILITARQILWLKREMKLLTILLQGF